MTPYALLERLHAAQGAFYAGGPAEPLRTLLADDLVWTVPGDNAIAGRYEGADAVMAYFARRRDLAGRTFRMRPGEALTGQGDHAAARRRDLAGHTFRMHPGEVLTGQGDHAAVLTDGTALIDGVEHRWSTVGLYRFRGDLVTACWLLPLDPREFDRIWS